MVSGACGWWLVVPVIISLVLFVPISCMVSLLYTFDGAILQMVQLCKLLIIDVDEMLISSANGLGKTCLV